MVYDEMTLQHLPPKCSEEEWIGRGSSPSSTFPLQIDLVTLRSPCLSLRRWVFLVVISCRDVAIE